MGRHHLDAGLEAFQQASIATGVPLAILLLIICYALVRALRADRVRTGPEPSPTGQRVAEPAGRTGGQGS